MGFVGSSFFSDATGSSFFYLADSLGGSSGDLSTGLEGFSSFFLFFAYFLFFLGNVFFLFYSFLFFPLMFFRL